MRIRSTKPEFWRSHRIASVDWDARLVLKALESYVDDNGVGKDDLELIVGDTFPRDLVREPSRALKRVQVAIDALFEAGLLWRYEHEGTRLLYIAFWESAQYINRPSSGRFPRPDGTLGYGDSKIGAGNLSPQEPSSNFSAGTVEQGNRGTVHTSTPAASTDDFEEAWAHWPKKDKKKAALDKFKAAARHRPVAEIVADIIRFGDAYTAHVERQFVPALDVWIRGERWSDDLPTGKPAAPATSPARAAVSIHEEWRMR